MLLAQWGFCLRGYCLARLPNTGHSWGKLFGHICRDNYCAERQKSAVKSGLVSGEPSAVCAGAMTGLSSGRHMKLTRKPLVFKDDEEHERERLGME